MFQLLLNFVIYPHYHFKCCCYRHYLDSLHLLMCLTCFIFLFVHSFISVLHPYLIQFRVTLDTLPHPLDSFLSSFPSFFLSFVPLPFNFFFSPPYLMHRSYNSSLVSVNTTAPLFLIAPLFYPFLHLTISCRFLLLFSNNSSQFSSAHSWKYCYWR